MTMAARGIERPRAVGAAIGLDHVGIVGSDLDVLAQAFSGLGFSLTPVAPHASGRTANRCVMLRDGGYLELMATVPGQSSATLERFLARGPGAHILALEVADEAAAVGQVASRGDRERSVGDRAGRRSVRHQSPLYPDHAAGPAGRPVAA